MGGSYPWNGGSPKSELWLSFFGLVALTDLSDGSKYIAISWGKDMKGTYIAIDISKDKNEVQGFGDNLSVYLIAEHFQS